MRVGLLALMALAAAGQTPYLPVRDLQAGMKGTGYTVFTGSRVEAFDVEILGVLENAGPKQAIILARLSGGPLAHTGVMQGMSGSPVYIGGKLIGAVALAFTLSKDPIAGIRPFEEMLEAQAVDRRPAGRAATEPRCLVEWCGGSLASVRGSEYAWGDAKLAEISTPVSFSGFTAATLDKFGPALRNLGLEPRQGVTGGGGSQLPPGDPASLKPGSMISVQLVSGDMSVGADGTVTHVDGKQIFAFGHRFLSAGRVEMPFASADVLTLLPNLSTSFKISTARGWLGTITHDYSTAVRGELGRRTQMMPVNISVRSGTRVSQYTMEMIRDSALTPFLVQMAAFSALDATERTIGGLSFTVEQKVAFSNARPLLSRNIYSGEFNTAMLAAQSGAIPVAYVMQTGFTDLDIQSIDLRMEAVPRKRQATVNEVILLRRSVRPGETVPLQIVFASEGQRIARNVEYRVPPGAQPGPLHFTVADGPTSNLMELARQVLVPPRTSEQVSGVLQSLRNNDRAYVRVWRADPSYTAQGQDLPSPPPSVAGLLARSQGGSTPNYTSKIGEIEVPLPDLMVSGAKTVSVEVKE